MAKIVCIANVGERDLYYNVGSTDAPNFCHFELDKGDEKQVAQHLGCSDGARYISEKILQRLREYQSEAQRLRYPILKTVLDDGVLKSGKAIDKLILVVTDQPAPPQTPERFYCRDSVNSGRVLKELIKRDYPTQVRGIVVVPYQQNPTSREQTYEFFGKLLLREAPEAEVATLHVSLSAGVPALNDSLQEQALRLYKAKCRFYEVVPPSESELRAGAEKGTLQPVSAKPFLRDLAVSIIEQLLNRYDYSGALEVLKMFQAVKFWDDEVEAVLHHAEHRLNLNFGEAAQALQRYKNSQPLRSWWQTAQGPQELDRVIEAYFLAEARYKNREYAEMLWRIRAVFEIGNELLARAQGGRPPTPQQQQVQQLLNSLLGLKNLSNDMLHDLKGVSLDKINRAFRPPQRNGGRANHEWLIPTLREIVALLSNDANLDNPYRQINEYLLRKLRS